jgi:hypothetical protein
MKRYTGKLDNQIEDLLKNNLHFITGLMGAKVGLGKSVSKTFTIDETVAMYNPGITKEEIKAWVWYRRNQGVPMSSWKSYFVKESKTLIFDWVKTGVIFYDPTTNAYVPFPVFVFGNLYTKIAKLKKEKEMLIEKFGPGIYEDHLETLEKLKPSVLSISNPVESERPIILAISKFPKEFTVENLRESSGVILVGSASLKEAYKDWLRNLSDENIKKTSSYQIINYYLENENKPRNIEKIEWSKIKKVTREEGERLFKLFLYEALETTDQLAIDAHYNSQYNSTAPLQYQKIPIGIEVSRSFMGNSLEVRKAQREGIAFMELVGSGIIAYDVGVGKTITAIIEVVTALKNGKCKRPVIAVPNPTYKNWIKEMIGEGALAGVLTGTGIEVNDWFNLGANYDHIKLDKKVKENTITLVSYEGLMKIGFNEFTQEDHFSQLSDIVGQSEGASKRDEEKQNEKFREIIGVGLKETIADIEVLGFDYVVIDEAHNFKNVFSEVKSGKDGNKQFHVKGGSPSNRGVKAFFLCNYIQRKYGRNVMLLTATPFTNSPLEIYSMLALVSYKYMKDNNIVNLTQFFEQYIAETSEYVVGVDGEIKQKNVVKSFNNRISLQKLINSHINFKTGEEANVPRPCKVNLPKTTEVTAQGTVKLEKDQQILTYLQAGDHQAEIQAEINKKASEGASKDDPGRLLSLMADSQNNALSPFLVGKSNQSHVAHLDMGQPTDYLEFINESPKIKYTMDCIATVVAHHKKTNTPLSGQVIYIDRGKQYFKFIKEYLEKELGYKKGVKLISNPKQKVDEVEFIQGGMSTTNKEKIKDAFNEGTCKVILGTSSIKEGINLQEKSTVLYNLYPNWNPTDIRQLEGRVWRQKNQYNFVRVVMPLMENSMDVFVFQKLEEKTSRINDLWNKSDRGNVLDEASLDPNEVKFALVTDISVLVRFELQQIKEELTATAHIFRKRIEDLANYSNLKVRYDKLKQNNLNDIYDWIKRFPSKMVSNTNGHYINFQQIPTLDLDGLPKSVVNDIERFQKVFAELKGIEQGNHTDKEIIRAIGAYNRLGSVYFSYNYNFDNFKEVVSSLGKIQRSLFQNRGYDENTDIDLIREELIKELEAADQELEEIKTEEFQDKIYNEIVEKKQKFGIEGKSIAERVKDFAKLNNLLDYKFEKSNAEACSIPTGKFTSVEEPTNTNKIKRLRIAKAKAKAILIQLELAA